MRSTPRPPVASLQHGHEVLRAVVDGPLGPELHARRALGRRSGGGEDARPEQAGELDGRRPDAARSAVHEQRFARLQPAAIDDVGPDRGVGLRQRGRVDQGNARRQRQALRRRRHAVLGVPAAGEQRADLVAHRRIGHALPDRRDGSGHFQPRDVGSAGGRRVVALALHRVGPIDPGRRHLDQHLARTGSRHRPGRDPQRLGRTGLRDVDDAHGLGDRHLHAPGYREPA